MHFFTPICVVLVVAVLMPSTIECSPITGEVPAVHERSNRHARATCDLLSIETKFVKVNHSACAAHCLVLMKGFKGGSCVNGVCVCRK